MQTDGNFVVYQSGVAIWQTETYGRAQLPRGAELTLQTDGNLVIYSTTGKALWSTNTTYFDPAEIVMQTDGNLVMYDYNGHALWSSKGGLATYDRVAAIDYADYYALHRNPTYPGYTDNCTNYLSQALYAGDQPYRITTGSATTDGNWWTFPFTDAVEAYEYQLDGSYSATVAGWLLDFLGGTGWGSVVGTYSYAVDGKGGPYPSLSVTQGDVLFYNWGQGTGYSHAAMMAEYTDMHTTPNNLGQRGELVDENSHTHFHEIWTLKPLNQYWETTTIAFIHVNL